MLQLKALSKAYRSSKGDRVAALQNIDLTLPHTGMVFVVGKSGCGKTTLLNMLGGLDKFDSGDMLLNGKSTAKFSPLDWDKYRNSYVSFVFQENNLLEEYNVFENIRVAANIQGGNSSSKVEDALGTVGLSGYGSRKINELSGGQKQRVAIARAVAKNSQILLTDEPTGSLDSATGGDIFALLKEISKTKLVVVVTHDKDAAERFGDAVIEMSDGKIVGQSGKLDEQSIELSAVVMAKSKLGAKTYFLLSTRAFFIAI